MRDNDLLDNFWGHAEEKPLPPKKWERSSCRELDDVFGITPVSPVVKPAPIRAVPVAKPAPKPVKVTRTAPAAPVRRKRRAKVVRVSPSEAIDGLAAWEAKLLKARKMVQKYRVAVKRYIKNGKIKVRSK
jgi:hypothetical protein